MSFDLKFEITGADKIQTAMDDLQKNLMDYDIPRTIDDVFKIGLQEAQRFVPVRTGNLRRSGRVTRGGKHLITLEFTASYAMATNENHPTQSGWFDKAVTYIENTLPTNLERATNEQVGIANRKIG